MNLSESQVNVFFSALRPLVGYANERLDVVERLALPPRDEESLVKAGLVAAELWANTNIIDDFVRDNPSNLSDRCLEAASLWKDAISGYFVFLGSDEKGRGLLLGEAGVFAVCGLGYTPEQLLGPKGSVSGTALLPFDGVITYDGLVDHAGVTTDPEYERELDNRLAEARASGAIVETAEDFIEVARAYNAEKHAQALDELLAAAERDSYVAAHGEDLPAGFHRSALAGLPEPEREAAIDRHVRDNKALGGAARSFLLDRAIKAPPTDSLADILMHSTKDAMLDLAAVLGMRGVSKLRKADLAQRIADTAPTCSDDLRLALSVCIPGAFSLIRDLAHAPGFTLSVPDAEADKFVGYCDLPLFATLFHHDGTFTALIPRETRDLVAQADFEEIERERTRSSEVRFACIACVHLYGVVSCDDAYLLYREAASDPLAKADFLGVVHNEATLSDADFGLWMHEGLEHLVDPSIEDHAVFGDHIDDNRAELSAKLDALLEGADDTNIDDAFERFMSDIRSDVKGELDDLESYRVNLVEAHRENPPRPLDPAFLKEDAAFLMLDLPAVTALRAFVDERIPDGENDYFFADRFVEDIVFSLMDGATLEEVVGYASDKGMIGSSTDPQDIVRLITNVYNALPQWEANGWSPQELAKRLYGRKIFYDQHGNPMKIGRNDPCPCGSGKKYKKCCGR